MVAPEVAVDVMLGSGVAVVGIADGHKGRYSGNCNTALQQQVPKTLGQLFFYCRLALFRHAKIMPDRLGTKVSN